LQWDVAQRLFCFYCGTFSVEQSLFAGELWNGAGWRFATAVVVATAVAAALRLLRVRGRTTAAVVVMGVCLRTEDAPHKKARE
jgi:anti-sigma-K factor RskA